VSQRLGLHVVARLARRHGIEVSLTPTPGCGVTAAVVLPASLFSDEAEPAELPGPAEQPAPVGRAAVASALHGQERNGDEGRRAKPDWSGWWESSPDGDLMVERPAPRSTGGPLEGSIDRGTPSGFPGPLQPDPRLLPDPRFTTPMPPLARRILSTPPGPPAPVPAGVERPATGEPLLSRRVPQAHLAPELRRHETAATAAAAAPLPDASEARAALSRYQASRQAARAVVDGGGAPGGLTPSPPVDAGDLERPAGNGGRS
jgi:hypothetical protein